jgi:hypothetical protein
MTAHNGGEGGVFLFSHAADLKVSATALQSASNSNNPGAADLGRRSEPIDQLSRVMLKVANVVELQFQFAEREPEES